MMLSKPNVSTFIDEEFHAIAVRHRTLRHLTVRAFRSISSDLRHFFDHGDAEEYRRNVERVRNDFEDLKPAKGRRAEI